MCEIRAANSIFNEFRHFTIFKMIKTNFKWDQLCGEKKSMLWRKIQYCGVKVNFSVKKQWETFLFKIISESSWIKQIFSLNKLLNHCFGFKQFCSNYRLLFSSMWDSFSLLLWWWSKHQKVIDNPNNERYMFLNLFINKR